MSATIILIMTSSSTRNTEPPGGRVAVMIMSLPVPSLRIANNANRRNVNVREHARLMAQSRGQGAGLMTRALTPRCYLGFHDRNTDSWGNLPYAAGAH